MISKIKHIIGSPTVTKGLVTLYDAALGALCMYLVIRWRYAFDDRIVPSDIDTNATLVFFGACIAVWVVTDTHKALWRFTSLNDVKQLLQAVLFATVIAPVILFLFFNRAQDFPRSVPFMVGPLFFFAATLSRMIILFFQNGDIRAIFRRQNRNLPNALLVGSEGSLHNYLRDVYRKAAGPGYNIKGLVGTEVNHRGRSIRMIPVLGSLEDLKDICTDFKSQYGAPPTLISTDPNPDRSSSYNIVRIASETGSPLVRVNHGRPETLTRFEAADLIGREVRAHDISPVKRLINEMRVMVTGAGGTIGSELTRQIAALGPARLILVDNSEFNLYEIDRRLKRLFPAQDCIWYPYLADVNDIERMEEIFEKEKPQIILHAAARKHVPLSESNPIEALKTNIGGTKAVLDMAIKYRARSFTLISTDKAVNPSNIMGASKRLAEMLTMSREHNDAGLSAGAVRFGNVLASTGSVVPLFEEQIANGGPVTVTHPDVTRYFMTTEEAGSLVLQAAALNATERNDLASIFVLEMGEPVKIAKLARQLIRLRGFVPDRDIKVVYTQLRPGEKLTETLTGHEEYLETTYVEGIQRFTGRMSDPAAVGEQIADLMEAVDRRDLTRIKEIFSKLLPDYDINSVFSDTIPVAPSAEIIPLTEPKKRK